MFKHKKHLVDHTKIAHSKSKEVWKCPFCPSEYVWEKGFKAHLKTKHLDSTRKRKHNNETDKEPTPSKKRRRQARKKLDYLPDEPDLILNADDDADDDAEERVYRENWHAIKTHTRGGDDSYLQTLINVRWKDQDTPDFAEVLKPVFQNASGRLRIQASNGFILKKNDDVDEDDKDDEAEFRYFHACENNAALFENPQQVYNQNDFDNFLQNMRDKDHLEHARQERPNTKYTVSKITNTSFYIYTLKDFPMGGCEEEKEEEEEEEEEEETEEKLPSYLSRARGLRLLLRDSAGRVYRDRKCLFRCLALYQGTKPSKFASKTQQLLRRFMRKTKKVRFEGVTLDELNVCESEFDVPIEVFEFDDDDDDDDAESPKLVCVRRSDYQSVKQRDRRRRRRPLQLLLYKNQHFCFIQNVDKLGHAFSCPKCHKLWKQNWMMKRHEKTCFGDGQKHVYSGGVYTPTPSPLETLEKAGLDVDTSQTFPFRATFDFESFLSQADLPKTKRVDSKTVFTARHVPLSVSVSSNVPGYSEPKFFHVENNDEKDLQIRVQHFIDQFVDYLEIISSESFELMKDRYQHVYDQIAEREKEEYEHEDRRIGLSASSLKEVLDNYLRELPVLGFNSSNYDLNLTKIYLFKRLCRGGESEGVNAGGELGEEDSFRWVLRDGIRYLVKQNNQFKAVVTPTLKFLDIANYLAPGCSYAQYLKAFDVREKKSHWPYEYIDSLSRLEETQLPPHEAFYSSLKKSNISAEEYAECQEVWARNPKTEKPMKNLWELLEYYNNNDVQPFLSAIDEQSRFFSDRSIDMFKDGIGIPGLTLRYLFKTLPSEDIYFSLFGEDQAYLHTLLRENLVGGPSIIFERYHEKGVTKIRGQDGKDVETLEGFDANALYLFALMQNMPCGTPVVRRKEDNFAPQRRRGRYGLLAREWLEWESCESGRPVRHRYNGGEQRLGKRNLPVDGWDPRTKTAYQFHGCVFHGCEKCCSEKPFPHPFKKDASREELRENTREITAYLREKVGVEVKEIWECEWKKKKKCDSKIIPFLKSKNLLSGYSSPFPQRKNKKITDRDIIEAIQKDKMFGLVKCDVEVPSDLRKHFSEMPPVFKNTKISKEDIGGFMREYADKHKLLSQPRRSLIGSMFGKQLVFTTSILQWYLKQGLKVSNVTLTVEYQPSACFREFGERVSEARRAGDQDVHKRIIAEIFKLLGNSAYGKTLTNIANHCDVTFLNDREASKKINSPLFKKLTPLRPDWNEVESKKKQLNHKLPLHVGFFVYQEAKLKMLKFHYDCIDKYIDRADYQLCQMDTDSYYMVLSTPTLEDAVRPSLRRKFFEDYHTWFPSPACKHHMSDFVETRVAFKEWVPKGQCCLDRLAFDKRTPGLFKLEYKGDGIVALCSKTYLCFGQKNDKVSTKGLSKKRNHFRKTQFLNVLKQRQSAGGTNMSFRTDGREMFTYTQQRDALSFLYLKRKVGTDGSSTTPLDI